MNPLQTILNFINQKQFVQGKQAASVLLSRDISKAYQPVILRLRATCFFALKEFNLAIDDLERACVLGMDDGEIFVNLAKAYFYIDELPHAVRNITKALACKDRFYSKAVIFLHKSLLTQLHESELSVLADSLFVELACGDQAKNALANILIALEKTDQAEQILAQLEADDAADIQMTRAVIQRLKGNSHEAVATLLSVAGKFGRHYAIYHQLGNCYSDLGELATACEHFILAINLNDQYRFSHFNLAELLYQRGLVEQMLASYEALKVSQRFNTQTFRDYLNFLLRLSKHSKVLDELEQYKTQFSVSSLLYFKAEAQRLSGDTQGALATIKSLDPLMLNNDELCQLSQHLISVDEYRLAKAFLDRVSSADRFNQWALSLYFLLSKNHIISDPINLRYEDYICEYQINAPDEYESLLNYLTELSDRLSQLHSVSENSPLNLTIQGGTQTQANLFRLNDPLISHLSAEFHRCVNLTLMQYRSKKGLHQGFYKQGEVSCSGSWSINTKEEGHHSNHIHPMGLISSVCYISLPDCISSDNGGLQFGVPPFMTSFIPDGIRYKPKCGVLYAFPSCFWHGTLPLKGGDNRLTVAADFIVK